MTEFGPVQSSAVAGDQVTAKISRSDLGCPGGGSGGEPNDGT
jgi:hypothetical protein